MNPKRKEYDGYDEANSDSRLVDADFLEKQSISSKATTFDRTRKPSNDDTYREEVANDAIYQEQVQEAVMEEEEQVQRRRIVQIQQQSIQQRQARMSVAGKLKGASVFARWMGIGIAGTAYVWQFLFGAASLVGFGASGAIKSFLQDTTVGKIVGFFIDVEKFFPFEYIGYGFWGLATLVAVCTFLGFLLWFYVTGVRFFDTPVTALVTILAFAFSILPVSNLFPSILVWIIYINLTSSVSSFKTLARH
jgi:hypothetical protein